MAIETLIEPKDEDATEAEALEATEAELDRTKDRLALDAIRRQNNTVKRRHGVYLAAKEGASAAKKSYEAAQEELSELIDEQQQPLLFQSEPDAEPDSWEATPISELDLSPVAVKAIEAAELTTIGDLAEWTKNYQISDIKGIGGVNARDIESELGRFWREHPQFCQTDSADETAKTDS